MGTVPLDVAIAAHEQAAADLREAIQTAMASDRLDDRLAMTTCLQALRYIERHGLTDGGRKQLRTAMECVRSVLGIDSD